ncbi:MAG: insulinase family protein [Erysipelotrichales bacterium]|nr:insulinase family protein [Erysipelotrichales bacterium]
MKRVKLSTDVKVVKSKDINTLEFRLIFPIKYDKDNHFFISLLRLILTTYNHEIRDYGAFRKEKLKNTILDLGLFENSIVDNTYLVYCFSLPREGLISDFDLEKSFEFAIYSLLHPACDNGEFDINIFNYEKEYIYNKYLSSLDGIYASNANAFYEEIDPENELGNTHEQDGEVLRKLDSKSLYEFYKKNILDNTFLPYVYGNISEAKAKKLFEKYIPQEKKSISFNINYFKPLPMKEQSYKEVITNYNQSELFLEYQIEMEEREKKYFSTLSNILNGPENNLIFNALRIKNNLVYDSRFSSFSSRAMFVIIAFIPSDKYKETKKIIKDIFVCLKDKEYLTNCLNKLIKGLEVDLLKELDGNSKPLNDAINKDLKIISTEELIKDTKSIKVEELISFIDRLKLTNEMFFRGDKND